MLLVAGVAAAVLVAPAPTASANVTPGVKPDIVLSPTSRTFNKHYTSVLVMDPTPQADASVVPTADQCRTIPALDLLCDVYRIKIVRDKSKGAQNFVVITVDWQRQASTPALALVATGLGDSDLPDLDLFLYKDSATYIDAAEVGGRGSTIPERISFEATQDEYDLVVRAGTGIATEYGIHAVLSNEKFGSPTEALDQATNTFAPPPTDGSAAPNGVFTPAPDAAPPPSLALAPLGADSQISAIGLGTQQQFAPESLNLGNTTRAVAATAKAPSTLALIVAMILFPAFAAVGGLLLLRQRRNAFVA